MNVDYVTLGVNGRVVIPANVRQALNLKRGDRLAMQLENGELRLTSMQARISKARALVRQYIKPAKGSLVSDELIADRRAEAARE